MCLAKRPELLLLDEPVAALNPLAREDLMHVLLESVVDDGTTVLLSSHAVADLVTICDYVIILSASPRQLADELDHVLASHRLLVGPADSDSIRARWGNGNLIGHRGSPENRPRPRRGADHRSGMGGGRAHARGDRARLSSRALPDLDRVSANDVRTKDPDSSTRRRSRDELGHLATCNAHSSWPQ